MKIKFYILFIVLLLTFGFRQLISAQTLSSAQSASQARQSAGILSGNKSTDNGNKENITADGFSLSQNNPNPFNLSTTIRYTIGKPSRVKMIIYNVIGREIKVLIDSYQGEGNYQVIWNGTDDSNNILGSGVYFCRLETDNFVSTKKMILMK